jgi:hypothetical protein
MKAFMIIALLAAAILLRPQMTSTTDIVAANDGTTLAHAQTRHLTPEEMGSTIGAGIVECGDYYDLDGDYHVTCCVNVWIFKICGDVNFGPAQRFINSIF